MPDILSMFQQQNNQTDQTTPVSHSEVLGGPPPEASELIGLPATISGDPEQQKQNERDQYDQQQLGPTNAISELYDAGDSWSPEYTLRGFTEEAMTSVMRGVGNHIIKGTGDLLQVAGGLVDPTISDGSMLSRALQEAGTNFASKFQSFIPEELQHENISWSSATNPKFWSTHIAEMIPQLAEFIFLSKGGASVAKKGAKALLKNSKNATKTALGKEVFGSGKGIVGKLATDQGLTQLGSTVSGAVGGGLSGNMFSGMLNAAEVINSNKILKDENDKPLYTEDQLKQMASGVMRNNAAWVMVDMASFGMTYGGGWKHLKNLNPITKGGKIATAAQRSKLASSAFKYDVSPIIKGLGRVGKKGFTEGLEETFQESYEEWAKKRAEAEVTGEDLGDFFTTKNAKGFYDFYNSKENEATKVIAGALGALGGSAFNIRSLINKTADDNYKLYNRVENLSKIVNKQGTEEELSWQQYHIRQQLADFVIDDKVDLYENFAEKLIENGNITEEEKATYDQMIQNFSEVKAKGKRLNVKGLTALMHNSAKESYFDSKIDEYVKIAQEKIETINSLETIEESDRQAQIKETEEILNVRLKALSILKSEAKQNQENLIIGKKAKQLDVNIVLDKYGNEMVVGGLSTQQEKELALKEDQTLEDDIETTTKNNLKPKSSFSMAKFSSLGKKTSEYAKNIYEKASGPLSKAKEKAEEVLGKAKEKTSEPLSKAKEKAEEASDYVKEKISKKQRKEVEEEFDIDLEYNEETGVYEPVPKTEPKTKKQISEFEKIKAKVNEKIKSFFKKKSDKEASVEAEEMMEDSSISENEVISDEDFKDYNDNGANQELINSIADKIYSEGELSNREEVIRLDNREAIRERIVQNILGTQRAPESQTGATKEATVEEQEAELTDNENEFVESETKKKSSKQTIASAQKKRNKAAEKKFKIDPKKIKGSEDVIGMDKREENQAVRKKNLIDYKFSRNFINRVRLSKVSSKENISQNEIDNYLNRYTTYNLVGPSDLDRMAVVNHNLKRMFPNTKDPVQAFAVKNLFESLGSIGLGQAIAGTIFIDSKVWNQDKIFMHEMSHIYYQLTQGEPETEALMQKALKNKALVKEIKEKYDDYTLYTIVGSNEEISKDDLINSLILLGADKNNIEEAIREKIAQGFIKTIPLSEQRYLKEEMFVAQLEGPLSQRFDKIFSPKTEPLRQASTKKWWGLLRKKGEIIESDNSVDKMLKSLAEDPNDVQGDLGDYLMNTFKAVTKGVTFDSKGLDARAKKNDEEYSEKIQDIQDRMKAGKDNSFDEYAAVAKEEDYQDAIDDSLETDGQLFYGKDFSRNAKGTTRVFRKFGIAYNKVLRKKFLAKNKDNNVDRSKQNLFNRDLFEATMYGLAVENNTPAAFILNIENSVLQEVQAFNRYLDAIYPDTKLQMLNSMHLVLSNSKHINGWRNTINDKNQHEMNVSFSQKEINKSDNILAQAAYEIGVDPETGRKTKASSLNWKKFKNSVEKIRLDQGTEKDFFEVLKMITGSYTDASNDVAYNSWFNIEKIIEQGYLTFRGTNIPIETLISGYIKKGLIYNKENPSSGIYYGKLRPLIESVIDTNRKFSPLSSVKNAEGNMEPVRITNNHLTKEVDEIIDFLSPDNKGKRPTKEEFLERFSHISYGQKEELGKTFVPNQFLENIYDSLERGILPTITQYHGIEDISNKNGSLFKNSTAVEQAIEDLLIFAQTSQSSKGKKNNTYLGNMGSFSDSPRKFFMNMKRVDFKEIFTSKNGKVQFNPDGKIINSIFAMHNKMYQDEITHKIDKDGKVNKNKPLSRIASKNKFKAEILKTIEQSVAFVNENAKELSKISTMKGMFTNNKLNQKGKKFVAEYTVNSIVNGYNVTEVFLPGVSGDNVVKRFKMNSSPVISVKNPNFKIEPVFISDEIIDNSIAGSDSGMFITEKAAKKLQALGHGVFEMNGGFKLLNASVEKDNKNFKGKTAYLKGYTTIIKEGHPLWNILTQREEKYEAWHKKKFGTEPSWNLADGSFNHMAIAIPTSSDKSNFFPKKFISKDADGNLNYTEEGAKYTPEALNANTEEANKLYDSLYYENNEFVGVSAYNFGPQQLMDKQTDSANLPVQLTNSIIVNASLNNKMELATEIQQHISDQKRKNLEMMLETIKSQSPKDYKELIEKGLNKEDMDQAQRILFEDGGSLSSPYLSEIITNQFAKTIRRAGNKLRTPGTYSHQKPDLGYRIDEMAKNNPRLKGYGKRADGGTIAAEIILPSNMVGKVKPRQEITIYTHAEQLKAARKNNNIKGTLESDLNELKKLAIKKARKRAFEETGNAENYNNYFAETKSENNVLVGYHIKGESVIASRVPGHGPSSTGVFEVIGFDNSEGNQVQVPSEFNDIIGADNDGDALFIQTKGDEKQYSDWNQAFAKIKEYWLSPEMKEQIQVRMDFESQTESDVKQINEQFPLNKDYTFPFSPVQRMKDYNNTMVSKRNVGPVFNIHKITNMLAAYEVKMSKTIDINGNVYNQFKDYEKGAKSRNQKSAILANIILDNSKHGFADALGLDEHNISQATLMVNLGIDLVDVGRILNSKPAKLWSSLNRNNNSIFHNSKKKETIINEIYKKLNISRTKDTPLVIDLSQEKKNGKLLPGVKKTEYAAIIELMSHLSDMNSDVQKVSGIMSGHNKIHVNPLVLEKQLNDFKETVASEKNTLIFNDEFVNNPELKNYVAVAEETLKHMKRLNPVYRDSYITILKNLNKKIGVDMSLHQLEELSKDLMKFNTSRLLGHNNVDKKYAKDLLDPKSPTSIYAKMRMYLKPLLEDVVKRDENNIKNSVTRMDNSILLRQALSMNLFGNKLYISANTSFVNESFNEEERSRVQEEFEELPPLLQDDLILYDMIIRGWKGPQSMAPFFGKDTNWIMNVASNEDYDNRNKELSSVVKKELEKKIALKLSTQRNNPYHKVYLEKQNVNDSKAVIEAISKDKSSVAIMSKGQPMYINVRSGKTSALYEIEAFTDAEIRRLREGEKTLEIAKQKLSLVENDLTRIEGVPLGNFDIALISDKNVTNPFETTKNNNPDKTLDPLVEATISFEEAIKTIQNKGLKGMDAREDYDIEMFSKEDALTEEEFEKAMEYKPNVSKARKEDLYNKYIKDKIEANELAETYLASIDDKSTEELLDDYETYGEKDAYAYSIIMTPIIKKLASNLASQQAKLIKDNTGRDIKQGKDISLVKAHMISGSTIPSTHPASQALARMLEVEYKKFINEKKKYISEMNEVTDALYKEKLGYGQKRNIKSIVGRVKRLFGSKKESVYQTLYGNLVIREESINKKGTLVYNYKLKPEKEIQSLFESGSISKAEKDFYDHFRKTTKELLPKDVKNVKEDYIPHTAMSNFEAFASRGLLGLMVNSRPEDDAIYDVKMYSINEEGEKVLMNFKHIEDLYKRDSAQLHNKNDINKIMEYRKIKSKAKKLLKSGKNEDGTDIVYSAVATETALGFGAINRFSNNRSIKATELPSMDLNKALGDYIHSTLFVNGNENFQGMKRLQGYIDGVLAYNRDKNLPNMNQHVQKVWKDYFLRGKRQTSFLGEKADKVILGLTRMNLFYALGYSANKNTGGLYAIGNILAGKYHNIKDVGGKAWVQGELRYWGLDKGFEGGISAIIDRHKRMARIMKEINFMEINVYDEVNVERKNGLDKMIGDLALSPMIVSEKWIQQVHMLGKLTDEEFNRFDDAGNYKENSQRITDERLVELEDSVKSSHGRGYQPTDQRAIQMYSWGNMMLQFSRFLPTMFHDRFAKEDVNIYGKETIGTLTAVKKMVQYVVNNPKDFVRYRKSLSEEQRSRLDQGLKGMAMASIISIFTATTESDIGNKVFWDTNYYWSHPKLANKMTPAAVQTTKNLVGGLFE